MKKNIFFIILFIFSCENYTENHFKNGMVVSAREEASMAGIEILKQGGNAFDAMIATDLALAVVYPSAGNLGGGGFMVYRLNNDSIGSLDYREKAPLKASKDMFLDTDGNEIKNLSTVGSLSIGIPGTVAGLFATYEKFGSVPLESIFKPAIKLAEKGFRVTKKQAESINRYRKQILSLNDQIKEFENEFKEGDLFINKPLAQTLKLLQKKGKDEFYKGSIGEQIVEYLKKKNGIIQKKDLEDYEPVWRDPVVFNYKDLEIISMGPPSSGGVVLGQIFKMLDNFDLSKIKHNDANYIKLLTEIEKRAFADRSKYLGDPDFNYIPVNELFDQSYLDSKISDFSFQKSTKSVDIFPGSIILNESNETTHYSIVDQFGNAVAVTTTLNGSYGSKLYPPNLGFFLNNEMDDFSIKPGIPNMYGLTGGEINSIQPQKRMLSSMTPTIVKKNGKLCLVLGSPGGPTIITSVLQTILNFEIFGFEIQEAVDKPRFHHLWLPDKIYYEDGIINDKIRENLENNGFILNNQNSTIGRVDAIHVDENDFLFGGADKRGDDKSVGY